MEGFTRINVRARNSLDVKGSSTGVYGVSIGAAANESGGITAWRSIDGLVFGNQRICSQGITDRSHKIISGWVLPDGRK